MIKMSVNNFKKLEEQELENLSMRTDLVQSNINANIGSMRFLTNVLELYFPSVLDLLIGLTGGKSKVSNDDKPSKYPDLR